MPVAFNPPPLPTHDVTAKTAGGGARQEGGDLFALLLAGLGSTLAASAGLERGEQPSHASPRDERSDNADAIPIVPFLALVPTINAAQQVQVPPELSLRTTVASALDPSNPAEGQLAEGVLSPPASSRLDTAKQLLADAKATGTQQAHAEHRDAVASAQSGAQPSDPRLAEAFAQSLREHMHKDDPRATPRQQSPQGHDARHSPGTPGEVRLNDPVTHVVAEGHKASSVGQPARVDVAKDDNVTPQAASSELAIVAPATSASPQAASMVAHANSPPAPAPAVTPMPVITIAQRVDDAGFAGAAAHQIAQVV